MMPYQLRCVLTNVKVESVGDDDEKSRYLQSSKSSQSTESCHLNPETRARLRALLESTGLVWHLLMSPNIVAVISTVVLTIKP